MSFSNHSHKSKSAYFFTIESNFCTSESMVYFFPFMPKIGNLFGKIFELEKQYWSSVFNIVLIHRLL